MLSALIHTPRPRRPAFFLVSVGSLLGLELKIVLCILRGPRARWLSRSSSVTDVNAGGAAAAGSSSSALLLRPGVARPEGAAAPRKAEGDAARDIAALCYQVEGACARVAGRPRPPTDVFQAIQSCLCRAARGGLVAQLDGVQRVREARRTQHGPQLLPLALHDKARACKVRGFRHRRRVQVCFCPKVRPNSLGRRWATGAHMKGSPDCRQCCCCYCCCWRACCLLLLLLLLVHLLLLLRPLLPRPCLCAAQQRQTGTSKRCGRLRAACGCAPRARAQRPSHPRCLLKRRRSRARQTRSRRWRKPPAAARWPTPFRLLQQPF